MAWRPPRRLVIMGRLIEVRAVSAEEMKDLLADNDGAKGAWDCDTGTIYLLRTLSQTERNRTFWHELQHALVDLMDP